MKLPELLLFGLFLLPLTISAQEEIETDRPDQTETTAIVPKGFFQMETGFMHEKSKDDGDIVTLPTVLYKYGISKRLELRLQTDFTKNEEQGISYGFEPLIIGAKLNIITGSGIVPETSLITMLLIPKLASKELQVNHVAPQIKLLFENKITDYIDLDYNLDAA